MIAGKLTVTSFLVFVKFCILLYKILTKTEKNGLELRKYFIMLFVKGKPDETSQSAFTCSKLTIETPEQRCEICSKLTRKIPG